MIDLSRTVVVFNTFPKPTINYENYTYLEWLYKQQDIHKPHIVVANHPSCTLLEARNRTIKDMVMAIIGKFDWFVFIDSDITLRRGLTEPFFDEVEADVVGCNHPISSPTAWIYPDQFHMGIVRFKGQVFSSIDPPWFEFKYNEDNTRMILCDCSYLRQKVLDAGFTITRQGYADHDSGKQWHGT